MKIVHETIIRPELGREIDVAVLLDQLGAAYAAEAAMLKGTPSMGWKRTGSSLASASGTAKRLPATPQSWSGSWVSAFSWRASPIEALARRYSASLLNGSLIPGKLSLPSLSQTID